MRYIEPGVFAPNGPVASPTIIATHDPVNAPAHYTRFPISPIRIAIDNKLDAFQFNIIKYVMRYDGKGGIEDLEKALKYLRMYIAKVKGETYWEQA
jgi:hypothetical protein